MTAAPGQKARTVGTSRKHPCPCGRILDYALCCGRLHEGLAAPDPEALMRARYSAFTLKRLDFLLATWHPSTRPDTLDLHDPPGERTFWLGLDVVARKLTAADAATVEFIARYRVGGGAAQRLHELSRFVRENGVWFYVDGDMVERAQLRGRAARRL